MTVEPFWTIYLMIINEWWRLRALITAISCSKVANILLIAVTSDVRHQQPECEFVEEIEEILIIEDPSWNEVFVCIHMYFCNLASYNKSQITISRVQYSHLLWVRLQIPVIRLNCHFCRENFATSSRSTGVSDNWKLGQDARSEFFVSYLSWKLEHKHSGDLWDILARSIAHCPVNWVEFYRRVLRRISTNQ